MTQSSEPLARLTEEARLRPFQLFFESLKRSKYLFWRASIGKTAAHFSLKRSSPWHIWSAEGKLSGEAVALLSTVIAVALGYYHWRYEGWRETIAFAAAVTATLVFVLTLASRRFLFSISIVAAVIAMIVAAASVKHRYVEMVLHTYDIVFYLTSAATLSFLWADYKGYLLALLASIALTGALGKLLFRIDSSRVPRPLSAALMAVSIAAAMWASDAKGERRNLMFYWDDLYLGTFYASWRETFETLWRGQLFEAAAAAGQTAPPFKMPATCTTTERPPHVLLIHQESVVPPSYFATLEYDKSLDPFFTSFDGKVHRLRTETYGGASWLTEFSVLTGVSTFSFGGMRTFVQAMMQGKMHDTMPQALARCGYQNSVFYPVNKNFVSDGNFFASIAMPDIFDFDAQDAKRFNERDKFYYGNVLNHIGKGIAGSKQPLFVFLLTSATHLPYNYTYDPDANVRGGGPGTDPEINEYLRRLAMAKIDYADFHSELARRFPNERFLIVQYGDHQPVATRTLLGYDKNLAAEDVKLAPDSPGYLTYYSINGVNYQPPPLPNVETLDVPYLGSLLLQAAGLPLSGAHQERLNLLASCGGRYYTCRDRARILAFHRRLIDSGLVTAR